MIVTPEVKRFIRREIKRYSKIMGLKGQLDIALEVIEAKHRNGARSMYGIFYEQQGSSSVDLLFLNVKKHPTKKALLYTLVHELVHRKHPEMKHGKKFDKIVDSFLKKS